MLRTGTVVALFALLGALVWVGPHSARSADELKGNKCVDKGDVANKAITKKKLKPGAVNTKRLRDAAVTPDKLALRIFDGNGTVVGPVLGGSGDGATVMLRVASGEHAGEFFTLFTARSGLGGRSVLYTLADCEGQPYANTGSPASAHTIPIEAWAGPDPALGADAGGIAIRPAIFLPDPDAVPEMASTVSIGSFHSTTGAYRCGGFGVGGMLLPLDIIDDPDLGSFVAPFRAGLK